MIFAAASRYAESVDATMTFIVVVASILLIGITTAMIYFVFRYSRKRNPVAKQIHGSAVLETTWVILPLIIVMVMFWYGYKDYRQLAMQSKSARIVRVTARMWKWTFEYNNGKQSDTLVIPVGESVRLDMRSMDVNHSFFVPAFRIKEDVLASQTTYLLLQPKETGDFDIACAEYCGMGHSKMYGRLRVVTREQFLNWLSDTTRTTDTTQMHRTNQQPTGSRAWNSLKKVKPNTASFGAIFEELLTVGRKNRIRREKEPSGFALLQKYGCLGCHTLDGSRNIGPSFKKLSSGKTSVWVDGKKKTRNVDYAYIKDSILNPDKEITDGYKKYSMPPMADRIESKDMDRLIKAVMNIR